MSETTTTLKREAVIVNELGLHARAAAQMAKIAAKAEQNVWILNGDKKVDAASVIDILTLACAKGETIILQAEAQADAGIIEEMATLTKAGFGE